MFDLCEEVTCAICRVVSGGHSYRPKASFLGAMSRGWAHRGPDDKGIIIDGSAVLAARRLSIIDIHGGHQATQGESGAVCLALDGKIHNYREPGFQLE